MFILNSSYVFILISCRNKDIKMICLNKISRYNEKQSRENLTNGIWFSSVSVALLLVTTINSFCIIN